MVSAAALAVLPLTQAGAQSQEWLDGLLKRKPETLAVKTPADAAWNKYLVAGYDPAHPHAIGMESMGNFPGASWVARAKARWAAGKEFSAQQPIDPRRWQWVMEEYGKLDAAMGKMYADAHPAAPQPQQTMPADVAAERAAHLQEYAKYRTAFMNASDVSLSMKYEFLGRIISTKEDAIRFWAKAGIALPASELKQLQDDILEYTNKKLIMLGTAVEEPGTISVNTMLDMVYTTGNLWTASVRGVYGNAVAAEFFRALATSRNTDLQLFAKAKERLFTLVDRPLEFRATSTDGQALDLAKLRGKVVIVDFWDLNCSSCIAMFPKLKEFYQQYKDQGFEMISISLDNETKQQKVLDFYAKQALPWSKVVAGKDARAYMEKYGIYAVPHMFIVDREGRVIDNGPMELKDITRLVTKLLADSKGK